MRIVVSAGLLLAVLVAPVLSSARQTANYDEELVPGHALPPLAGHGAELTREHWEGGRRDELLALFEAHVYGVMPAVLPVRAQVVESGEALGGTAVRTQIRVEVGEGGDACFHLLILSPTGADGPSPAFLGLNFFGNHTVTEDPAVILPTSWTRNNAALRITGNQPTEESRGLRAHRWPAELLVSRGYALATIYCGDIAPDDPGLWRTRFGRAVLKAEAEGDPGETETGAIGLWAYGLSRAFDAILEVGTDVIDPRQVAVIGHSRLGKTALWAGAIDNRFSMVVSNNSGCGGAALSRRRFGERLDHINRSFPHWFCGRFSEYNGREQDLPVDQHQLIALIAPRPVYVASATSDQWADPRGEFLAAREASPVWELYGGVGITANEDWPAPGESIGDRVGYHLREGAHDITEWDWVRFIDFADRHFQKRPPD